MLPHPSQKRKKKYGKKTVEPPRLAKVASSIRPLAIIFVAGIFIVCVGASPQERTQPVTTRINANGAISHFVCVFLSYVVLVLSLCFHVCSPFFFTISLHFRFLSRILCALLSSSGPRQNPAINYDTQADKGASFCRGMDGLLPRFVLIFSFFSLQICFSCSFFFFW